MVGRIRRLGGIRLALLLVGGVLTSTLVSVGPASADVGASASFTVPDGASVGATNLNALITVTNMNSAPNQTESNRVTDIKFAPSCGTPGTPSNPCAAPDPGVFSIHPGFGAPGTACAGQSFSVSPPDSSGAVTFQTAGSVLLAPPGGTAGSDRCTINFTMDVVKVPGIDVSASPGVQTSANLRVTETGSVSGLTPVAAVSQTITVNRGMISLTTQASPGTAVGGSVADVATLTVSPMAARPTGTVTFTLFGPDDSSCSGASPPSKTSPVTAPGSATASGFVVTRPGVYRFVASYSGDANYLPVAAPCNAPNESLTVTGTAIHHAVADFNGDGITDVSVFRPSTGAWYVQGGAEVAWGTNGDIAVPANYNGTATTDTAVFRPSNGVWYVRGGPTVAWGTTGDVPVPADYDGDGKTDVAVFRTGVWYVKASGGGPDLTVAWGTTGDIAVPGDYNGDGKAEVAVFRPSTGTWYVKGGATVAFGTSGDVPVPGDYDGNATTDMAVFRPSTGAWYVNGGATTTWGTSGDMPVAGDYNGDGRADVAVFRPSTSAWYVAGGTTTSWGTSGDRPLPLPAAIRQALFG